MSKTVQEQLAAFEAKRMADAERMSALMSKAADEGRTLDEDEAIEYEDLQNEVRRVDEHLRRLRDHERILVSSAQPITPTNADDPSSVAEVRGNTIVSVRRNAPAGSAFTRYAMLLAASRGNLMQAKEMARERYRDMPELETVLKAAVNAGSTTDPTWAGNLVQYTDMAGEFIELLRPTTIIGRIQGFRRVPFNVRMPRQTAGASANWVGQGAPKPVSDLAFDTVALGWSKISVIIAMTEELVRFSSPSAEAVCRQDMIDAISQFMDEQFIDPSIAAVNNVSPASVLYGVTPESASGDTVADVTSDVQALLSAFVAANHAIRAGVWVMNPRTALHLSMLRTQQDVFAFPTINMNGGTFFGFPVVTSNSVPTDYGSPTAGAIIALIDAADILLADDGGVTLDVSREASLQMSTTPSAGAQQLVSLWQNNLIGLRAERYINYAKRRASAAMFLDEVLY